MELLSILLSRIYTFFLKKSVFIFSGNVRKAAVLKVLENSQEKIFSSKPI